MSLLDFLFPRACVICGNDIKTGCLCCECDEYIRQRINPRSISFSIDGKIIHGTYLFEYGDNTLKKLIFQIKRSGNKDLLKYAAALYGLCVPTGFEGYITNVPRKKSNIREFGYDHVQEPAKALAKEYPNSIKYVNAIKRRGFSFDQKNLSASHREKNVKGKFKAVKKDIDSDILVLDDVVTTGSTIKECVREVLCANPNANIMLCFLASADDFSRI